MSDQAQLCNMGDPMQNENTGPFAKIIKNYKVVTAEH